MIEDGIPRTVKPRDPRPSEWLPIIAIHKGAALCERTGEVHNLIDDARSFFLSEPESIVVIVDPAGLLAELEPIMCSHPDWQYKVIPTRTELFVHSTEQTRPPVIVDTVVSFFGFRSPTPKKRGHWYHPIDPYVFTRLGARAYLANCTNKLDAYMKWGQDVRSFCQAQHLRFTTTGGGLAGQLLRDPRFYREPRRKIPRVTNAQARTHLPGNFYRLYADDNVRIPTATYLDLKSAHHNSAATITFPHADRLQRRGDWETTDPTDPTPPDSTPAWEPGTDSFRALLERSHGLLRLRLRIPKIPPTIFAPPYMDEPGLRTVYAYTNELPYILELGCAVEGIDAAWTSFMPDPGLNRYATWALSEIATMNEERKRWAKPVLLSAYGLLAAKPRPLEFGFRQAKGGRLVTLPAGSRTLQAYMRSLGERESPTVNVIQRGMIEAETRIAALRMATRMTSLGHRVLSIYADAVFIEPTGPLPLMPPPWEVKGELTNLVFLNATSFESDQVTKLPGVVQDLDGRARARHARARIMGQALGSVRHSE